MSNTCFRGMEYIRIGGKIGNNNNSMGKPNDTCGQKCIKGALLHKIITIMKRLHHPFDKT
jgi:hypothetical protein